MTAQQLSFMPEIQPVQWSYERQNIPFEPYLDQAIKHFGITDENAIFAIEALVTWLYSELEKATAKPPTTFFGKVIRMITGLLRSAK